MMCISAGSFVRPIAHESVAGDACLIEAWQHGVVVAAADGLGHGPAAAVASSALLDCVRQALDAPLGVILENAHRALVKTRGAVAVLARFDEAGRSLEVAGVGNVTALLASGSSDPRRIVVPAGVVGSAFRPVRPQVLEFCEGDALVLHTDGVQGRFALGPLRSRAPAALARAIVDAHGKPADDAGCLVAFGMAVDSESMRLPHGESSVTFAIRTPVDAERCAVEARRFASHRGFAVKAQWEVGIAVAELASHVLRVGYGGRLTVTFALEPREEIVVEATPGDGGVPEIVHRMMDSVTVEGDPARTRVVARKVR
jgi:hypothetical protein